MLKKFLSLTKVNKRFMHPFTSEKFSHIYNLPIKEALISIEQLKSSSEALALISITINKSLKSRESSSYVENWIKSEGGEKIFKDVFNKIEFLDLRGMLDLVTFFNFKLKDEHLRQISVRLSEFLHKPNNHDLSLKCQLLKFFSDREEYMKEGTLKQYFLPKTIEDFYINNELEMNVNDKIVVLSYLVKLIPDKSYLIENVLNDIYNSRSFINGLSFLVLIKNVFEMYFNRMVEDKHKAQDNFYRDYFTKLDSLPIVIDPNTQFNPTLFLRALGIYNYLPIVSESFIRDFFNDNLNKLALKDNIFYSFPIYVEFLEKLLMKHADITKSMAEIHIKNIKADLLKSHFYTKLLCCNVLSIFANNDWISYQDPIFIELKEILSIAINNGELVELVKNYQYAIIPLLTIKKINLDFRPIVEKAIETVKTNIPLIEQFLKEIERSIDLN